MTTASPAIWSGTASCTLRSRQRGGGLQLLPRPAADVGHRQVQPSAGRGAGTSTSRGCWPRPGVRPMSSSASGPPAIPRLARPTSSSPATPPACCSIRPAVIAKVISVRPFAPVSSGRICLSCCRRSRPADDLAFPVWAGKAGCVLHPLSFPSRLLLGPAYPARPFGLPLLFCRTRC